MTFETNITRRSLLAKGAVALPVIGLVGLEASCLNATGLLQKIDTVTKAAIAVVDVIVGALGPGVTIPYAALVQAWLASIEGANAKALAIANGVATLTPQQITQIIGIYAGAVVFNIPGVPAVVTSVINGVIAAIDTLLTFLGATPAQTAAFKRNDMSALPSVGVTIAGQLVSLPTHRGLFFKEHIHSSVALNNKLGSGVSSISALISKAR